MWCFADISALNHENKARYSSIIFCITLAQYCILLRRFLIVNQKISSDGYVQEV